MKNSPVHFILFISLFCLSSYQVKAQRYVTTKGNKIFWANVYNADVLTSGILYAVNDTSVVLLSRQEFEKFKQRKEYKFTIIPSRTIYMIKVARVGKFTRSLAIGALAGLVIGGVVGASQGDDPVGTPRELTGKEKMGIGAGAGLAAGVICGFVYGITKRSFAIKNDMEIWRDKQPIVQRKAILD